MLEKLASYQQWQGKHIRKLLSFVPDDDFRRKIDPSMKTLRDEVLHIAGTIQSCFARLNNTLETFLDQFQNFESLSREELINQWELAEKKIHRPGSNDCIR